MEGHSCLCGPGTALKSLRCSPPVEAEEELATGQETLDENEDLLTEANARLEAARSRLEMG